MNEEQGPTTAIALRDDSNRSVTIAQTWTAERDLAVESASLICRVSSEFENTMCLDAMTRLKTVIKQTEEARKECVEPVWNFKQEIDSKFKSFSSPAQLEYNRIAQLAADFAELERSRLLAQQNADRLRLDAEASEREKERQKALAGAKTEGAQDAVNAHFNQLAQESPQNLPVTPAPVRAEGQRTTFEWQITVTDAHQLYRFHANCCKLIPILAEIKTLLDAGIEVKGVTAKKVAKVGVRLGAPKALLDI